MWMRPMLPAFPFLSLMSLTGPSPLYWNSSKFLLSDSSNLLHSATLTCSNLLPSATLTSSNLLHSATLTSSHLLHSATLTSSHLLDSATLTSSLTKWFFWSEKDGADFFCGCQIFSVFAFLQSWSFHFFS